MSKKRIAIGLAVLIAITIASKLLISVALPEINLEPEVIAHIGSFPVTNTFFTLIIAEVLLVIFVIAATRRMKEKPGRLQNLLEMVYEFWYDQAKQSLGNERAKKWTPLVSGYFLLILFANYIHFIPGFDAFGKLHCHGVNEGYRMTWMSGVVGEGVGIVSGGMQGDEACTIIPMLRGPTTDLNFAIALALVAFLVIEYVGFTTFQWRYVTKFVHIDFRKGVPTGLLNLFIGLIELISEVARVLSFSFRLFGNMFAGAVLLLVITYLTTFPIPVLVLVLELFVGLIQAYVFAALILAFMQLALLNPHEGE